MRSAPHASPPTPLTRPRLAYLDLVRFAGLLLVVAGHVWAGSPLSGYVAVFFVITGYLWRPGRNTIEEARHRFHTLLVPYACWLAVLGAVYLVVSYLRGAGVTELVKSAAVLVWGGEYALRPFTAFWFLTAIFVGGVIYRAITRAPRWVYIATVVASVVASAVAGDELAFLPLGVGVGFCCIMFIAAGHGLQVLEPKLRHPLRVAVPVAVVALVLIITGVSDKLVLKGGDFGTPLLSAAVSVVLSGTAILLASRFRSVIPSVAGKAVTTLVTMSTPIILLHAVPLWVLEGVVIPGWVMFALCLALPVAVGAALLPAGERVRALLMPGRPPARPES